MKTYLAGLFTMLAFLVAPAAASAVSIAVNTTDDEYGTGTSCSLREAVTAAQTNASFGGCPAGFSSDTITLPGGEYKITRAGANEDANATGDFDITGANQLDIQPAGASDQVTVNGNGLDRVFDQLSSTSLKLLALRVNGGKLTGIEDGGGIRNSSGVLYLDSVTVDGNASKYQGGGIADYNNVQVVNSTISGNSADGNGGGFYVPGGASLTVRSSTIYGNKADADSTGGGYGGGFAETGGISVNFTNVINAGNTGTPTNPANNASDCYSGPNFYPRFTLSSQTMGPLECLVGFNPGTNKVAADPGVDSTLKYNGGQTPTHNLLAGSPAIGAGGTAAPDECPGVDQNGVARTAGTCDIGAVNYVEPVPPDPPVTSPKLVIAKVLPKKKVVKRKKVKSITVVASNIGDAEAAGVKVCLALPKASKKGLKFKGKACRTIGSLAAGATSKPKIKLMAKPRAKKKAYKVKVTLSGTGVSPANSSFKLKVK